MQCLRRAQMGSSSSKLKSKLKSGDEDAALYLFETKKDLRKNFDPNASFGEKAYHDTALHFASRHAMDRILRVFLYERGGSPNKRNSKNETPLHCACQLQKNNNIKGKQECVSMILEWKGIVNSYGGQEEADLKAQDKLGNTPLHYAAYTGFMSCVQVLVDKGAPLFTENNDRQTPCDVAVEAQHEDIASYLESKMVFFGNDVNERPVSPEHILIEDHFLGLKPQELREAKDRLIVETSDMLRIPLFTAEALLRNHEWSREVLLEAWFRDPFGCCEKSGVAQPETLHENTGLDYELDSSKSVSRPKDFSEKSCEICYNDVVDMDSTIPMACAHWFCKSCWTDYLNVKITEGNSHNIFCPAYGCHHLVPVEYIEKMVSCTMARRYLQFDIKAFVESNPHLRWCPSPGCGLAIQIPERSRSASVTSRNSVPTKLQPTRLTVHCNNGHSFCWACQLEPHEPATCDQYKLWLARISEVKKEEFQDIAKKSEAAANTFWMISNSKKCPNCKSPIEKNEGCNHMRCSKCKHDFCWVCLEAWKWHNSMTGGFFRCTRYDVVDRLDEQLRTEMTSATRSHNNFQDLNRFIHYYTRYENHKHSLELEKPLLERARQKMAQLACTDSNRLNAVSFIEQAITALTKARHILQFSYIYGFYLQDSRIKKMVFELLQTDLEEKTESLSEIIARPYLRTPKSEIVKITRDVLLKTDEFVSAIYNGLSPNELAQGELKPLAHLLITSDSDDSADEQQSAKCKAEGCDKLKLRHSEAPDQLHDYCSLNCLKSDYLVRNRRKSKHHSRHQQRDLLQALEMSRLQLLQDADSLTAGGTDSDESADSPVMYRRIPFRSSTTDNDTVLDRVLRLSQSVYAEEQEEDLNFAIQMSLQNPEAQERMLHDRSEYRRQRALSQSERPDPDSSTSGVTPPSASDSSRSPDGVAVTPLNFYEAYWLSGAANPPSQGTPAAGATSTAGTNASRVERDLIQARLAELDSVIHELLQDNPNSESLRRTESDRRDNRVSSNTSTASTSVARQTHRPIRRCKSERR